MGTELRRRKELQLVQQALNNGWNITEQGRSDALSLVRDVLADPLATERELIRAAKICLLMEAAKMEIEFDDELLERVKAIGFGLNLRMRND